MANRKNPTRKKVSKASNAQQSPPGDRIFAHVGEAVTLLQEAQELGYICLVALNADGDCASDVANVLDHTLLQMLREAQATLEAAGGVSHAAP